MLKKVLKFKIKEEETYKLMWPFLTLISFFPAGFSYTFLLTIHPAPVPGMTEAWPYI